MAAFCEHDCLAQFCLICAAKKRDSAVPPAPSSQSLSVHELSVRVAHALAAEPVFPLIASITIDAGKTVTFASRPRKSTVLRTPLIQGETEGIVVSGLSVGLYSALVSGAEIYPEILRQLHVFSLMPVPLGTEVQLDLTNRSDGPRTVSVQWLTMDDPPSYDEVREAHIERMAADPKYRALDEARRIEDLVEGMAEWMKKNGGA
jgi:hypothetical protein